MKGMLFRYAMMAIGVTVAISGYGSRDTVRRGLGPDRVRALMD
jgi:hypothetical protein